MLQNRQLSYFSPQENLSTKKKFCFPKVRVPMHRFSLNVRISDDILRYDFFLGSMSAGSDLYYEPFRWDQKFVPFILSVNRNLKVDIQEVQALADATGGEVVISDSLQSMLGTWRDSYFVHHILTRLKCPVLPLFSIVCRECEVLPTKGYFIICCRESCC